MPVTQNRQSFTFTKSDKLHVQSNPNFAASNSRPFTNTQSVIIPMTEKALQSPKTNKKVQRIKLASKLSANARSNSKSVVSHKSEVQQMLPMSQIIKNQLLAHQTEKNQAEPEHQQPDDSQFTKVLEPRERKVTSSASTYDLNTALQLMVNSAPTAFASPVGSPKPDKASTHIPPTAESLRPSSSTKAIIRQLSPSNVLSKTAKQSKNKDMRSQKSLQLDLNMVQSLKLLSQYQQQQAKDKVIGTMQTSKPSKRTTTKVKLLAAPGMAQNPMRLSLESLGSRGELLQKTSD